MTMTLVLACAVVVMFAAWRAPSQRARRARRRSRNGWCRRQQQRRMRLWNAGVAPDDVLELSQIVEHAGTGAPLELESLLDRYVDLVIARQRCLTALYQTNADRLAVRAEVVAVRSPRLARVLQRRISQAHDIAARASLLHENLRTLAELIRHCAERALMPGGAIRSTEQVSDALDQLDADREVELALQVATANECATAGPVVAS